MAGVRASCGLLGFSNKTCTRLNNTLENKEELLHTAIDLDSRIGAEIFCRMPGRRHGPGGPGPAALRKGVTMFTDPASGGVCFVIQGPLAGPEDVRGYSPIRQQ